MASAPIFYQDVKYWFFFLLMVITLVVEISAFVHCATRRSDAFLAVGSIPKVGWLAMTGGAVVVTLLLQGVTAFEPSFLSIFAMIALVISMVYLLDVRPALKDAIGGRGSW